MRAGNGETGRVRLGLPATTEGACAVTHRVLRAVRHALGACALQILVVGSGWRRGGRALVGLSGSAWVTGGGGVRVDRGGERPRQCIH